MGCVVEWHRRPLRHGRRRPTFLLATRSKAMFLLWTEPKGPVVLLVVSWGAGLGRELPLEAGSGPVLGPNRSCPDLWSGPGPGPASGPGFGPALVFVLASATATAFASRSYYEASQASCVVVVAAVAVVAAAAAAATILPLLALTSNSTSNQPTITDKTKQNRIGKTNQKKNKRINQLI